ncbi:hypothetical protein GEMRC1_007049 [Eukaryota sp. GEM-RC1]
MASLSHPFVLRVFGITRLPQHIGILMELGSGHLPVPTSLSPTTLAQAIDICSAVKYLHSKGIVHHDIKPQNIIIVNSQVKLAEFGSSRTNSDTSSLQVSCKYTPPEAFNKIFDLVSQFIVWGYCFMKFVEAVLAKQQEHLLSFPEGFPVPISSLINKCLSVDPSERPSINDVLKELKDIQETIEDEIFEFDNSPATDLQIEKNNEVVVRESCFEATERGDYEVLIDLDDDFLERMETEMNERNDVEVGCFTKVASKVLAKFYSVTR